MHDGPIPPAPRAARLALLLAALLPVLLAWAPRGLWAPEEPRFGRVAHEMAVDGDWLVTRIDGKVDGEKPPLLFWMIAGIERVVGRPTAIGARVPGALLALLGVLATARLARRWFADASLAATAGLLFGTTALAVWNGPRVGMDMALAAFAAIALEGATAAIVDGAWAGAVRLGVGLGLGLLVKGPHVLYVPLAGALGGVLATRRRTNAEPVPPRPAGAGLRIGAGVALAVGIFAAWLVPALALRGDAMTYDGERYGARLVGQLARRVAGENEPHQAGPLYLLPLLLAFGLPWTPFAVGGGVLAARVRRRPAADRFGLGAALAGVVLPLVLLSIPASKRETYLVPLLPCASILAAYALHRARPDGPPMRHAVRALAIGLGVLALAVAAVPLVAPRAFPGDALDPVAGSALATAPVIAGCVVVALAVLAGAVFVARAATPVVAVRRAAVVVGGVAVAAFFGLLPIFEPTKSFDEAAARARREVPGASFGVAATSDPSALWWDFGVERLAPRIDDHAALAGRLAADAPPALVLAKGRFWTDRAALADAADVASLARVRVLWAGRVNGYVWHLLTNAPR